MGASIWELGGYFEKGSLQVEGLVKIEKEEGQAKRNLTKDLDKEDYNENKSKSKNEVGSSNQSEQSNLLINLNGEGLIEKRMRTRKEQFKSRASNKPDAAAELAAEAKLRREEHLDSLRKLELVKLKLTPKKSYKNSDSESIEAGTRYDDGDGSIVDKIVIQPEPNSKKSEVIPKSNSVEEMSISPLKPVQTTIPLSSSIPLISTTTGDQVTENSLAASSKPSAAGGDNKQQITKDEGTRQGQEEADASTLNLSQQHNSQEVPNSKSKEAEDNQLTSKITINEFSALLDEKLNPLKSSISNLESSMTKLEVGMNSKIKEATETFDAKIISLKSGVNEDIQQISNRMYALAEDIEELQNKQGDAISTDGSSANSKRIQELEKEIRDLKNFWQFLE